MFKKFVGALLAAVLFIAPTYADDLSNGSWSTTDSSNNAAPPNGWPAGMFPNAVEPTARSNMGGVRRWWERANPALSTTGSAGAYVLTPTNTSYPTAYTQGEVYCAKANFASVGGDTLNVNSLGAKPLYVPGPSSPIAIGVGQIPLGQQFCAGYDGALNSAAGGFQVLSGLASGPQSLSKTITVTTSGGSNFVSIAIPSGASGGCNVKIATTVNGIPGYAGAYADWAISFGNYSGAVNYNIGADISASFSLNNANLLAASELQATGASSAIQLVVVPVISGASSGAVTDAIIQYNIVCYGVGNIVPSPLI